MKSPIMNSDTALTTEQLQEKLVTLDAQLETKQAEHERLQAALPHALLEHIGSDLAGVRERKRLNDLADEIRALKQAQGVLDALMSEALQRDAEKAWSARIVEARRLGKDLQDKATTLHAVLVRVVALAADLRKADEAFVAALPGNHTSGFEPNSLSIGLMRRLEVALYALSDGKLRPRQMLDNPYQIRESGRADIGRVAEDYVTVGLRGRAPPRFAGPPDAA